MPHPVVAEVVVRVMHLPTTTVLSGAFSVVGIAVAVFAVRRYRRTRDAAWLVVAIAEAVSVLVSAAAVIIYFLPY